MENNLEVADSYLNLAANFIKLKEAEKAREYLDTAYAIGMRYNYYGAIQMAFKIYSEYYSEIKNYEQAYVWLRKYESSQDSILADQNSHDAEFDFDIPEVTEQTVVPEQHIHNVWLLIIVFSFVILIPFILIRFKR